MGYLDKQGLSYFWNKVKTYVDSKISGVPVKPVTQAQYNALSEEEKNGDAVYLVTDAVGSGSGSSGGSSEEIYSTEETRIGTWIDGKPLYRKTILVHFNASVTNDLTYVPISGVDYTMNIVKVYGFLDILNKEWTGRYVIPYIQYVGNKLLTLSYYIDWSLHNLYIVYLVDGSYEYSGEVTVEYTKTTDSPEEVG